MSDAAIASIVTGIVTAVISIVTGVVTIITLWMKQNHESEKSKERSSALGEKTDAVGEKVDNNTKMTKAVNLVAAREARTAATVASDVAVKTEEISKKLNGGVDSAIREAVAPIQKTLEEHTTTDDKNVQEVNEKLRQLTEYVHDRNHKVSDALQSIVSKQTLILKKLEEMENKQK